MADGNMIMTYHDMQYMQHIARCYNCLVKRYATSGMTATNSVGVESLGNIYWKTTIGHPDDFPWTHRKNQHNYVFHCFPLNPAAGYGLFNPKFLLIKSPWSWIIIPPRNPPRHFLGVKTNKKMDGWRLWKAQIHTLMGVSLISHPAIEVPPL